MWTIPLNTAVNPETSQCVASSMKNKTVLKLKISYLHHLHWRIPLWSCFVFRWGGRLEESFFWCPEQTDGWAFPRQTSWNKSWSQTEVWPLLPIIVMARREPTDRETVYFTGIYCHSRGQLFNRFHVLVHSIAYNKHKNLTVIKPHAVYMLTFIKKKMKSTLFNSLSEIYIANVLH